MASTAHETIAIPNTIAKNDITNPNSNKLSSFSNPSPSPSKPSEDEAAHSINIKSSKSSKQSSSFNFQGPVLTGAAALAAERRAKGMPILSSSTPNPATNAIKALMPDQQQSTDRLGTTLSQPTTRIADADGAAMPITDEPMQIDQGSTSVAEKAKDIHDPRLSYSGNNGATSSSAADERQEERSNKAYTYPPRPDQLQHRDSSGRGMSLPGSNSKSPGSKKHKCNHCGTEFTRHHNLKSHLLTHSQEKPFCCDRCDQKFRRLHDLKRHTKLHTGERPHTCPKCGRAFARGDALARHNKGPGGCAGRRGSGGEEELEGINEDENMEGIVYDQAEESHNSKRRKSEQAHSRKRSFQSTLGSPPFRQHSSTYPGLAPTKGSQSQTHAAANGSTSSNQLSPRTNHGQPQFSSQLNAPQPVFGPSGMTESPKPLSPGAEQSRRLSAGLPYPNRARSPSLAQQQSNHQPHQFGRSNDQSIVAISGLPPPNQPVLPSLVNLASESQKPGLTSSLAESPNHKSSRPPHNISTSHALAQPGPNSAGSTNPPSASSQQRSSGGSMREILNPGPINDRSQELIRKADADQEVQRIREYYENIIRGLQEENNKLKANVRGQPNQKATSGDTRPMGQEV